MHLAVFSHKRFCFRCIYKNSGLLFRYTAGVLALSGYLCGEAFKAILLHEVIHTYVILILARFITKQLNYKLSQFMF